MGVSQGALNWQCIGRAGGQAWISLAEHDSSLDNRTLHFTVAVPTGIGVLELEL